jgi:hypothetical protein
MNKTRGNSAVYSAVTIAMLLHAPHALADINLSGFASMTGGKLISSDSTLDGYDDDFLFEENSFLGIQANADLGNGLSAVAQMVTRGKDNWNTKLEWAYLGYEVNDNIKIIAGRQRMPFYSYSDYVDVSYAFHWITPPEATYSVPFNSGTGLGVLINNNFGATDSNLHIVVGRNTEPLEIQGSSYNTNISNMVSAAWTLNYDWLTFRAGYSQADIEIDLYDLQPLADGWALAGAGFSQATNNPSFATEWAGFSQYILANDGDEKGTFGGLGLTIDYNDYLFVTEHTSLTTEGSITQDEATGYYLSFGKRLGSFTPHFTYGAQEVTPSSSSFLDTVPRGVSDQIDGLIATTQAIFGEPARDNTYYILGLRWDFHNAAALKLEYKSQNEKLPVDNTNNLLRFAIVTVF